MVEADGARNPAGIIEDLSPGGDTLVLETHFSGFGPEALFDLWTDPERICAWWPRQAEIEQRPGGRYHLSWPDMGWHLRGTYTVYEPGRRLAFTWMWDHNIGVLPAREVSVTFVSDGAGGTVLTIVHGPYADTEPDQEDRRSSRAPAPLNRP